MEKVNITHILEALILLLVENAPVGTSQNLVLLLLVKNVRVGGFRLNLETIPVFRARKVHINQITQKCRV